jgi:hypothetical protein
MQIKIETQTNDNSKSAIPYCTTVNQIMAELVYNAYFQKKLPVLTREYFEGFVDIEYPGVSKDSREFVTNHIWLGYQCCRGDFDTVLEFLETCSETQRNRYLSERSSEFWNGNLLHMVLYWNTGDKAFEMYVQLREMGARLVEDKYNNYPWEYYTAIWTAPTLRTAYGNRDYTEFVQLYHRVEQWELEQMERVMLMDDMNNDTGILLY